MMISPSVSWKRHLQLVPLALPPLILTGLVIALYTWKCLMLILFQNAIIYNPFLPPNAKSLRIADFARYCRGVEWREERISSLDGTCISLCVSQMSCRDGGDSLRHPTPIYILYFQGNASSLPPRLPDISAVLRLVRDAGPQQDVVYTTVCLSYRGYWTSHDRPSEKGINKDAQAALQWIGKLHGDTAPSCPDSKPAVLLWGQSIGCGFATNLAAMEHNDSNVDIIALVLETPFTSLRAMLKALYPQRWLPFQRLWPFLRNHLDSYANLGLIAARQPPSRRPHVCIIEAAKDELVPQNHGTMLAQRCHQVGLIVELHTVPGALHNSVMVQHQGRQAIAQSIQTAVAKTRRSQAGSCK